jgi:hypothetical protein
VPASSRSHCGLRSVPFWWCLLCSLHCDAHFFAAPVRLEIAHSPCTSHWIVLLLLPGLSARLQCSAVLCCAVLCCAPLSCSSSSSSSSSSSCLSAPAESYSQLGCRMYPSLADRQMRPKTLFQARPGQASPVQLDYCRRPGRLAPRNTAVQLCLFAAESSPLAHSRSLSLSAVRRAVCLAYAFRCERGSDKSMAVPRDFDFPPGSLRRLATGSRNKSARRFATPPRRQPQFTGTE